MPTNNFLPFSPTDTGTNLLSQSDYAAAADRTVGNQPGVASSKLNNKALRQSSYVSSQIAQYLADKTGADVLDDNTPARLLAQINAAMKPLAPALTKYASGSGNHNLSYVFMIATGSATVGATYTNNTVTFTVKATVASGVQIVMTGNGAPTVSGTLTKASGTGDATLTFYAMRAPLYLKVLAVGGGAGGSGGGASGAGDGTNATATTFGTTLISAGGGVKGVYQAGNGGAGGSASLGTGPEGVAVDGAQGGGQNFVSSSGAQAVGGNGGPSALGGGGGIAGSNNGGPSATTNSGSGGSGGGGTGAVNVFGGCGGGAGAYVNALITTVLSTYAYVCGAKGTGGAAGVSGSAGGDGGAGLLIVEEHYQ